MTDLPAIVVVAFQRDKCLARLLNSLLCARYPDADIRLIISIDGAGHGADTQSVFGVAEGFQWPFGTKEIIHGVDNLGVRKHVLSCGRLAYDYGAVILLEEDLIVGPGYYAFSCAAASRFAKAADIAGFSLYSYAYNEDSQWPFRTISDEFDNYFMKVPSSWGQMWTARQWNEFETWLADGKSVTNSDFLPRDVVAWPDSSWKKLFWKYLSENNKFLVYPSHSHTTNPGDIGAHHITPTTSHQTELTTKSASFRLAEMEDTVNVYDQFFELAPEKLESLDGLQSQVEVDVQGTKPLDATSQPYLLSSRKCSKPIKKIPLNVYPINLNLLQLMNYSANDTYLSLGKTSDFADVVDRRVIEFIAGTVTGTIIEHIKELQRREISKSDEFVIGARWVKFIDSLPKPAQRMLRSSFIFRNTWKQSE